MKLLQKQNLVFRPLKKTNSKKKSKNSKRFLSKYNKKQGVISSLKELGKTGANFDEYHIKCDDSYHVKVPMGELAIVPKGIKANVTSGEMTLCNTLVVEYLNSKLEDENPLKSGSIIVHQGTNSHQDIIYALQEIGINLSDTRFSVTAIRKSPDAIDSRASTGLTTRALGEDVSTKGVSERTGEPSGFGW